MIKDKKAEVLVAVPFRFVRLYISKVRYFRKIPKTGEIKYSVEVS